MIRKLLLTSATAVLLTALSSVAHADTVFIGPGSTGVTGTVSNYSLTTVNGQQRFTFTISNTSSTGSITAVGFNLPGTNRGTFTLTSTTDPDFQISSGVRAQAGAQTSTSSFDFALLTGKNFGGGTVSEGLTAGTSATFVVTGNFSGLTAQQIAQAVFLRFQGIGPGDQSEVIGGGTAPVPEPMTMLLFGTGLAGVAARVRRRKNRAEQD